MKIVVPIDLLFLFAALLTGLKLFGAISVSWFWVLLPVTLPAGLLLTIVGGVFTVMCVSALLNLARRR
jgi:hypothetical protein